MPAEGAAEGEGEHAILGDVDADARGQILVLAQRAEHPAEAAGGEPPDREPRSAEQHQEQNDRRAST